MVMKCFVSGPVSEFRNDMRLKSDEDVNNRGTNHCINSWIISSVDHAILDQVQIAIRMLIKSISRATYRYRKHNNI